MTGEGGRLKIYEMLKSTEISVIFMVGYIHFIYKTFYLFFYKKNSINMVLLASSHSLKNFKHKLSLTIQESYNLPSNEEKQPKNIMIKY